MAAALTIPSARRKQWTRDEVRKLLDQDFFQGRRYELIEGDLIAKMGQKPAHFSVIGALQEWLSQSAPLNRIRTQGPVDLGATPGAEINEPEPDVVVASLSRKELADRHPLPHEIALLVEVADTSLEIDLGIKARLYARAGIVDYWVVDLRGRRLIVHRNPSPEGYRSIAAVPDSIAPLCAPDRLVTPAELLPSA